VHENGPCRIVFRNLMPKMLFFCKNFDFFCISYLKNRRLAVCYIHDYIFHKIKLELF